MDWEYYNFLENYDNLHFKEQEEKIKKAEKILKENGIEIKGKILDIGAGTCIFAKKHEKADVYSLEPSELLKKGIGKRIQGIAEKMPFKNNFFDFAVSFTALHHCNLKEAKKEIKRVLKPNGIWAISFFKRSKKIEEFRKEFKGKEFDLGIDVFRFGEKEKL